MAETADLQRAIDELFVGSPEAFTGSRNALAKQLKAEGDAAGATRVAALRRPARSAWAVNRLVRQDLAGVEELLSAGERLRAVQRRAMSTKGAEGLRDATKERDRLVNALTRRAVTLLGEQPSPAVVEEIAATLEAASADEATAAAVLQARLSKPFARPAGFGAVFGLQAVPEPQIGDSVARRDPRAEQASRQREIHSAGRRERQAQERMARLRSDLAALKERLVEREEQLRFAEVEARNASREVKRLRR